ncbi:MAG: hypothetical protein M3N28_00825 [Actinomycetota bacterium]|nr:hypothetical protein [Actinomycetota bacterium]
MRAGIAAVLALLPPIAAVAFVKLTSSPRDANVGAALFLIFGVVAGLAMAAVYLTLSSQGRRPR